MKINSNSNNDNNNDDNHHTGDYHGIVWTFLCHTDKIVGQIYLKSSSSVPLEVRWNINKIFYSFKFLWKFSFLFLKIMIYSNRNNNDNNDDNHYTNNYDSIVWTFLMLLW